MNPKRDLCAASKADFSFAKAIPSVAEGSGSESMTAARGLGLRASPPRDPSATEKAGTTSAVSVPA